MSPRRQRFVDEYLIDLNAKQAAIRAGYAPGSAEVTGSRLLSNANVAKAVAAAQAKRAARTEVTQDYVLSVITDTIERCRQAVEVLDREGSGTGEYKFEPSAVLKGAELLGRHLAMFTDKSEVKHDLSDPLAALLENVAENGRRLGQR